jgi:hypothetical protein
VTNRNKAKGTKWESDIVRYLKANGIPSAHRVAQTGRDDSGDIHGVSPFILQAKDLASVTDGARIGVAGANSQAAIARESYGAAVVKRRNHSAANAYVVMDLETFTRMLAALRGLGL